MPTLSSRVATRCLRSERPSPTCPSSSEGGASDRELLLLRSELIITPLVSMTSSTCSTKSPQAPAPPEPSGSQIPLGAVRGVANLDAVGVETVPDEIRGLEASLRTSRGPQLEQGLNERADHRARIGESSDRGIAETGHHRPQHLPCAIGFVALKGVGRPGPDRLLKGEHHPGGRCCVARGEGG